ncbi:hypothetical protein ILUMI_12530 [Ignelater luminosus]|uniref:Uncharacterized protein n=1 Tax=Ignelater luminosus TaxID=2038154 RepID=A0A8K0CZD9_IGNLU|nr:hypothetical protein ILUMI_12530 [Ignelater luminosus]
MAIIAANNSLGRSPYALGIRLGVLIEKKDILFRLKSIKENVIPLNDFLKQNRYEVIGTFRDNRITKSCPLKSKGEMKKSSRETYDSCIAKVNGTLFARRVNNEVNDASTTFDVDSMVNVKRYLQLHEKFIQVPRPYMLGQYNNFIGGTAQMD